MRPALLAAVGLGAAIAAIALQALPPLGAPELRQRPSGGATPTLDAPSEKATDIPPIEADRERTASPSASVIERAAEAARVRDLCEDVTDKLASVALDECTELGLHSTRAASVQGWPIVFREYPPLEAKTPRGRVLVIGGIHGDEYSSVSVVFKWMWILDRFHSGLFHWHIAPLVNPDGLLRRKSQRTNANGVDLNRNFPTSNWESESADYWVLTTHRNPRRFPGDSPLSEPEAAWLAHEIETFAPDVIVSVHAPAKVVDFDGPPHPPRQLGSLVLDPLGTYPGSLGRYAGVNKDIPVVTIELASAGAMPSRQEYTSIWIDLVAWLKSRLPEETRVGSQEASRAPKAATEGVEQRPPG